MKTFHFLLFLFFVPFAAFAEASESNSALWMKRTSVQWSAVPLRESLRRFAELQQFDFVLDRRVDPSLPLEFEATHRELGPLLDDLAASLGLGCFLLDSVAYIGPKESTDLLPKLLAEQRKESDKLSPRWKTVLRRKITLQIPFLGKPKEILGDLADRHGFRWTGLETLPHDLWDENTFSGTLDETLTLLLIGFGMDYKIETDTSLTLVALPEEFRKIPAPTVSSRTKKPKIEPAVSAPPSNVPLSQRRFTLRVEDQRLDTVLQTLTQRLGLKLELDEKSLAAKGISTDRRISFEVKNATAQELFRAVLKPLKLEFRLRGDAVQIR